VKLAIPFREEKRWKGEKGEKFRTRGERLEGRRIERSRIRKRGGSATRGVDEVHPQKRFWEVTAPFGKKKDYQGRG